jgi:hypothetical protein
MPGGILRSCEIIRISKETEDERVRYRAATQTDSELFQLFAKVRKPCTDIGSVRDIMKIRTDKVAAQRFRETVEAMLNFGRLAEVDPNAE